MNKSAGRLERRKDELEILRALSTRRLQGRARAEAFEILAGYSFVEPIHQVIFDALREIPAENPQVLREQLAVRLNNKGFPDLDLESFFAPPELTAAQAAAQIRALSSADKDETGNTLGGT